MLNIEIKTIPHKEQAYNTVGDYSEEGNKRNIIISDLNNWKYETLVAIHEMVEQSLCLAHNISAKQGSTFDKDFQTKRTSRSPVEPGDQPEAPYHNEHALATTFEKELAKALDVDWNEYNKVINEMYSKAIQNNIF